MKKILIVIAGVLMLASCVNTKVTNHVSIGNIDLEPGRYIFDVIEHGDSLVIDIKEYDKYKNE